MLRQVVTGFKVGGVIYEFVKWKRKKDGWYIYGIAKFAKPQGMIRIKDSLTLDRSVKEFNSKSVYIIRSWTM